jgi:hypothetical protein
MALGLIRKIPNQTNRAIYYPPLKERELEDVAPNYSTMSVADLVALYPKDYQSKEYNKMVSENGKTFRCKTGNEDVYKKTGYESEVFEYLDRQYGTKRNYRLTTDANIDFKAGGWILVYGQPFLILKVIDLDNDVTTQNQARFRKHTHMNTYAPKLIALG